MAPRASSPTSSDSASAAGVEDKHHGGLLTAARAVESAFPGALPSSALARRVRAILSSLGFAKDRTLVATSFCCDELCRDLEGDLRSALSSSSFGGSSSRSFSMGGLAGFPLAGVTGFKAMAGHIPEGGDCVVAYGPHVGVDWDGTVGRVTRWGRPRGGEDAGGVCCGSANAALARVLAVRRSEEEGRESSNKDVDKHDLQQRAVESELLPYAGRLAAAACTSTPTDVQVELAQSLFDAQDEFIREIISRACGDKAANPPGFVALLGGVQINTPDGVAEYFLPRRFQLLDNRGEVTEDLLSHLLSHADDQPSPSLPGHSTRQRTIEMVPDPPSPTPTRTHTLALPDTGSNKRRRC